VLDGLTFCGLVVGQAVTINMGVVEGVWGADGVAVGKSVTKYIGVGVVLDNTISYTKLYLQAGISFVNMACS
jgi:hypothetical protein